MHKYECQTSLDMHSLTVEDTVCNKGDNQDTESFSSMLVGNIEPVEQEGIVES